MWKSPVRYGRHDPSNDPTVVLVRGPEKYAKDREHPYPERLLKQREQINNIARRRQLVEDSDETP